MELAALMLVIVALLIAARVMSALPYYWHRLMKGARQKWGEEMEKRKRGP